MKPRRDTSDFRDWQMPGQRTDQRVTPHPVQTPHLAQLSVVTAAFDQPSEDILFDAWDTLTPESLRGTRSLDERSRHHQPPQPQGGSQCLADSARIEDTIRCEALQSANRRMIVAELNIVVIFESKGPSLVEPADQLHAAILCQYNTRRKLMSGCDKHCLRTHQVQAPNIEAVPIDRNRNPGKPGTLDSLPRAVPRVLHGEPSDAAARKHLTCNRTGFGKPARDYDMFGVSDYAAYPPQIFRERGAQLRRPVRAVVAQRAIRHRREYLANGPQPELAWELGEVWNCGAKVETDHRFPCPPRASRCRCDLDVLGNDCTGTAACLQVAFGRELLIRIDDYRTGYVELIRKRAS